jgi:hypothetical protein
MTSKSGKDKKEDDQMVKTLYSEISLRKAMSKQHMKMLDKYKRSKRPAAVSYTDFKDRIFYLD